MPDSRRISDRIASRMDQALEASGEKDALFEVSVLPMQSGPTLTLVYWFKSPLIGQMIVSMQPIQNPFALNDEGVDDLVRQAVEFARQERSKSLAPQNGHREAGPGLIAPPH